jgi:tetratricopeptide (TPR) repeat protein
MGHEDGVALATGALGAVLLAIGDHMPQSELVKSPSTSAVGSEIEPRPLSLFPV